MLLHLIKRPLQLIPSLKAQIHLGIFFRGAMHAEAEMFVGAEKRHQAQMKMERAHIVYL